MTSSVQAPTAPAGEATVEQPKRGFPWGVVGSYASIVIILMWCLAPFYYMIVMAFRDPDYALDTSLVPSHLTLSNFKYAFNTTNNHFGRSLVNGVDHRHRRHGGRHGRRCLRRLRDGPAAIPLQVRHPRGDPRGLDVPRRGDPDAALPAVLGLGLAGHLPGPDRAADLRSRCR